MKKIINIEKLKTQQDVNTLKDVLNETRLDYEISLANSCLILDSASNDLVRVAVLAIQKAGFQVL